MMCDAVILHSIHVDGDDDDGDAGSRMVLMMTMMLIAKSWLLHANL